MANETEGNERNMNRTLKAILLSAGLCSLPSLCFSAEVYNNAITPDPLGQQYHPLPPDPATLEFGDEINLSGIERTLTQYNFYYFFSGASVSAQNVTLSMYANTGVAGAPAASPFYTSDPFPLGIGFVNQTNTIDPALLNITLPDTFTWTVKFSNLAPLETGGLLVYGPPRTGTSLDSFWQNDGTAWRELQLNNGATAANFGFAVAAVPEPGVLALGGLGALLLAGLKRFRKAPR